MRISKRAVWVVVLVAAISAVLMALAVSALGARGGNGQGNDDQGNGGPDANGPLIRASLAPSLTTDPVFHGVNPGGAPWMLQRGEVRLKRDGTFDLRVRGLVIPNPPGDGTPGPVNTINASLYCGADSVTTAAATTQQVPISRTGDARIDAKLSLPPTCLAPVILVHPNGAMGAYIALDGWRS